MKNRVIDAILWAWPVMPRRVKLWAFLNDDRDGQ